MQRVGDVVGQVAPALAFLAAGVPLAALLDRLGFFGSVAGVLQRRSLSISVGALWAVAALTTVVLNLDTTIVLLTPLYLRLARREGQVDRLAVAVVPLLLASLSSSVLPISNLTTLIAANRLDLSVLDVVRHLALPSLAATVVGWVSYRRRHPTVLVTATPEPVDRRALLVGGAVVGVLLVAFVAGPEVGVAPWMAALVADLVLMSITRAVPWRSVPFATIVVVGAMAVLVGAVTQPSLFASMLDARGALPMVGASISGVAVANVVNNIPATLLAVDGLGRATPGFWAWLLGTNAGAVLLPIGALANLLWLRILRTSGERVSVRSYVAIVWPVAVPAFLAAIAVHALLA